MAPTVPVKTEQSEADSPNEIPASPHNVEIGANDDSTIIIINPHYVNLIYEGHIWEYSRKYPTETLSQELYSEPFFPPLFVISDIRGNVTDDEFNNQPVENSQARGNLSEEYNPYENMDLLIPVRERPYDPNYESASTDGSTYIQTTDEEFGTEEEEEEAPTENSDSTSQGTTETVKQESDSDAPPNVGS